MSEVEKAVRIHLEGLKAEYLRIMDICSEKPKHRTESTALAEIEKRMLELQNFLEQWTLSN